MAEEETRASPTELIRRFTGPTFWRLGKWGVAASVAVSLAYFIGSSDLGLRRMATAFANVQGLPQASAVVPRENAEVVRLSEALRRLTNDRDRLLARLDTVERNLDDLTGSISQKPSPPNAPESAPPEGPTRPQYNPQTVPPGAIASVATPSVPIPMNAPAPMSAPATPSAPMQQSAAVGPRPDAVSDEASPVTAKVDFGVDLGSAQTVEGLRVLWNSTKSKHAKLLDGMRPIIALRENTRPGNVELRLVVGPLASAALAARLCVVIITTGTVCQPAVFDGQRLAMR